MAPRAARGGRLGGCWPCPHKDTGKGHPRTADVSSLLLRRVYGTWTGSAARCTRGGRRHFWQPGRARSRVPRPARWSLSNVTPQPCPLLGTAQVPAVCQRPVPALYCGSMAIDFFFLHCKPGQVGAAEGFRARLAPALPRLVCPVLVSTAHPPSREPLRGGETQGQPKKPAL